MGPATASACTSPVTPHSWLRLGIPGKRKPLPCAPARRGRAQPSPPFPAGLLFFSLGATWCESPAAAQGTRAAASFPRSRDGSGKAGLRGRAGTRAGSRRLNPHPGFGEAQRSARGRRQPRRNPGVRVADSPAERSAKMGGPRWQIPWQATLLAASILSSCFLLSQGQAGTTPVTVEPATPREGDTVTLKPGTIPGNSISCRWYRGATADANLVITFFLPPSHGDTKGPKYTGRETVDSSCSLQITDLKSNYSGTYRLSFDGIGVAETGSANVTVIESVTNVTITSDPIKVFENSKTVLTCTSAGTYVSYFWLKGSQSLEAEGHISMSNNSQVLTFNPVSRNDSDIYTCYGNNTFSSNHTSYALNVFYGPDELVISPDNLYHEKGSSLNLTCKADSNPSANYTWSFQESVQIGSTLSLIDLSFNDTGNYTCEAFNNETGLNSFKVVEIKVLEKLSQPILSPANYVALENENITLYCNISSGTAFNISWFRNGEPVSPKADISENKKNLTLPNFTSADAGTYTCVASNQISSETSNPSNITLAYGPVNITVDPAGVINQKLGSKLHLLCMVDSNPAAQFQWFINGTVQRVMNNSFSVDSVAWKDGGNYTCQANNTVTKNHASTSVIVKVANQGPSLSSPAGLGGGAIAGIVLGSLAVTLALTGTLFYFFRRGRHQHVKTDSPVIPAPSLYENIPPSGPVRTEANPENSSGISHTYETLQFRDQAVYQEIK